MIRVEQSSGIPTLSSPFHSIPESLVRPIETLVTGSELLGNSSSDHYFRLDTGFIMTRVLLFALAAAAIVAGITVTQGADSTSSGAVVMESKASGTIDSDVGPSFRGRTLMADTNRGRFPECQRNKTRCLDPRLNPDGTTCCINRCVNTRTDTSHCGRCSCTCAFNEGCCDARCVNLATDPQNCGACGVICDDACVFGLCAYGGGPWP